MTVLARSQPPKTLAFQLAGYHTAPIHTAPILTARFTPPDSHLPIHTALFTPSHLHRPIHTIPFTPPDSHRSVQTLAFQLARHHSVATRAAVLGALTTALSGDALAAEVRARRQEHLSRTPFFPLAASPPRITTTTTHLLPIHTLPIHPAHSHLLAAHSQLLLLTVISIRTSQFTSPHSHPSPPMHS